MSSLHPQDRVSLCRFTFSDGRRCRTPRAAGHPDFCHYHAEKDARDRTAAQLGDDFAALFSGTYISACDLSAALARLLAAVARGHVRPRTARTLAFLTQTLLQSIRLSQHEFITTFGNNAWRQAIGGSVNHNIRYLRDLSQPKSAAAPQTTQPQPQPQPQAQSAPESAANTTAAPAPPPAPPKPMPPKSARAHRNGRLAGQPFATPVQAERLAAKQQRAGASPADPRHQPPITPAESTPTQPVQSY